MTIFQSAPSLAAALLCAAAFAASDARAQAGIDARASASDEIIVTATRREEAASEAPVSLTVFAGEDLIDIGARTINALENFTPNLEIESQFGSGQPSFQIRGVGFRDYATLNAPTVGVYVDDVAYPIPVMTQGQLFDVARVEVLRGPQGTLYGRNTTGGAIKVVSNAPTDAFAAGGFIEAGRFSRVDAEGYVSGPVGEQVRIRLSGAGARGGEWQENRETGAGLGDAERYAVRLLTDIDVAEDFALRLNVHGFIDRSDGLGLQLFNDSAFGPAAHDGRRETSFGSSQEFSDLTGVAIDQGPFRDNEGWGASAHAEWALDGFLGGATLTSISAVETLQRKEFNDFDALSIGGAGVYFETSADVFTQELRLASDADRRFRYLLGGYYAREDLDEVYQSDFVASFGPGFAVTTPYRQDVRTLAGFLNLEFDLTDALTLAGGIRYEDETRALRDLGTFATGFGSFNFANGTLDGALENRDLDAGDASWRVGLDYRPTDAVLLYASYARGVKSGGFTAYNTLNPAAIDPFEPERLDAFELGAKLQAFENRLAVSAAAFYYDYEDQQVQSAIFDPGVGAIVGRIVNAPQSEIFGGELELTARPAHWLTVGQSLGYKEGEFTEFLDLDASATATAGAARFVDRAGQSLGLANWSYQGFVEARAPLGASLAGRARVDYSYRDKVTPPLLGPVYAVDDYWLANALIALAAADGAWEVALWGRNIFNADFDETRNFFIAPDGVADVAAPGPPATYGVRLTIAR